MADGEPVGSAAAMKVDWPRSVEVLELEVLPVILAAGAELEDEDEAEVVLSVVVRETGGISWRDVLVVELEDLRDVELLRDVVCGGLPSDATAGGGS